MMFSYHGNRGGTDSKIKHIPRFDIPVMDKVYPESPFQACTQVRNLVDEAIGPYYIHF